MVHPQVVEGVVTRERVDGEAVGGSACSTITVVARPLRNTRSLVLLT